MPTLKHGDTTIGYEKLYVKAGVGGGTRVDSVLFGPDDTNKTEVYPPYRIYTYTVDSALSGKVTVTCTRTSSPNAGASTGALSSGDPIYTGDTLSYTFSAISGYYIFTTSTGSVASSKSGSETVNGNVYLTCDTIAYYWLTFSIETGYITASCTRSYSRVSSASIGSINPSSTTTQIFAGDTLSFSASSSSGYYVLEASTRDSTSYSETISSVSGNVTRQFHAVQKSSYTFRVYSSSTAVGGTYPYSGSVTIANIVEASVSSTNPYKPYTGPLVSGVTTYSSSTTLYMSGTATSRNQLQVVPVNYYTYAQISVSAPVQVDYVFNPFETTFQNTNNFSVDMQVTGNWEDSSGVHTISGWLNLDTLSAGDYITIYPTDMDPDANDDAEWYACALRFRFVYTVGGVTYYSSEYAIYE